MNERMKTLLWLAVLVAGIAASVVQLREGVHHGHGHGAHGHDHGSEHRPKRLFSWEPQEAHALLLVSGLGTRLEFMRGGAGWQAGDSRAGEAGFDPQAYVHMLSQARSDREIPLDQRGMASLHLDKPELTVRVADEGGRPLAELLVGGLTPDGFGRYVLPSSGNAVHIVPNYQFIKALQALAALEALEQASG